jgi:hypothetical protein
LFFLPHVIYTFPFTDSWNSAGNQSDTVDFECPLGFDGTVAPPFTAALAGLKAAAAFEGCFPIGAFGVNRPWLCFATLVWVMSWGWADTLLAQGEGNLRDFSVAPLRVDVKMESGALHTETLGVFNAGDEPVHMRASAADWFFNEKGAPQYVAAGKHPSYSCGPWIGLNPAEFDVPPHKATPIRFTLTTPPGQAVGGYHCAVTIGMAPGLQPGPPETGLRILVRFAPTIYVVIGEPQPQAELVSLDVVPVGTDAALPSGTAEKPRWQYLLTLQNTGQTHFRVNATLELVDQEGKSVSNFKVNSQPILPESQRTFTFTSADELVPGDYTLTATIDIGLNTLLQKKKKVRIEANAVPPPQSPSQ